MCSNTKLLSETLCECVPLRTDYAEKSLRTDNTTSLNKLKICIVVIEKLLNSIIDTRCTLSEKKGRDETEATETDVERQSCEAHLDRLCLRVSKAQDTLEKISRMAETAWSPICALQMILSHHIDKSAEGTNHFISRVEKALRLSTVTRLAKDALKRLTAFYDSYRQDHASVWRPIRAFVYHRTSPS